MDNFKTYRIEESGVMTPMVNVWMTHEEYDAWKQGTPVAIRETIDAAEKTTDEVMEIIGRPSEYAVVEDPAPVKVRKHQSHASPHSPGVYGQGTARISEERMKEFVDAYVRHRGETVRVARELNVSPGTVSSYKSIAVKYGLLNGINTRTPQGGSTDTYQSGSFKLSVERMKEFLDSYEKFAGNYDDIAADLNIKPGSVSAYKSVAIKNGLLANDGRTSKEIIGKDAISIDRAKEVATIYQIVKGNVKRVARALGVTEGTAKTYVKIAQKRGLL